MASLSKRLALASIVAAASIAVTAVMATGAAAQGRSNGIGAGAPATPSVGSGATGTANRGGAGGVSNPSPGGEPATVGTPGHSAGPQGTDTTRSGYVGGRTVPAVTPPTVPPGTTMSALVLQQFGNCPTATTPASGQARLNGDNLGRIDTVAQYLGQGAQGERGPTARYLLADLQEELEKPQPDLTLAGTYLGLASGMPLTPTLVSEVSESLCAPVSDHAAHDIAGVAETQRRKLTTGN